MKRNRRHLHLIFLGIVVLGSSLYAQSSDLLTRSLTEGWQFRSLRTPSPSEQVDWHAAIVPGVVQDDLLRYSLIPDPAYGLNEPKYQWVGLSDWEYRTTFSLTPAEQSCKHIDLVFDGLDTFADVYLNGEPILHAENMFRQWRLPVRSRLHPGENENKPASLYTTAFPRFMSEYGFESFPEMATLRRFAPADELRLDSATMTEHQKSMGAHGNQVIAAAVQRDYGKPVDFPALVYLSQVEQADTVRTGAEDFRRLRPRTMGSLYWELQDGWPDIYSASIDYYGRWKALQWYARRFYAPLLVSPWRHAGKIDIFAISDLQHPVQGSIRIRLMDFYGKVLQDKTEPVNVPPLSSVAVLTLDERQFLDGQDPRKVFAVVEWLDKNKMLSSSNLFFLPVKDLLLPKADVHWTITADGSKLRLSSNVLARDVMIGFQDPDIRPSDDYFDLLPGKPLEISVPDKTSLRDLKPHIMSIADALASNGGGVAH